MDELSIFPQFTNNANVWIYGFTQPLSDSEKNIVQNALKDFVSNWNSHGQPVNGDFLVLYNKFAILGEESSDGISGCSIDSSVRVFKYLKERHGLDALNHNLIHYRCHEDIISTERAIFQELISAGKIIDETIVFDTTVRTVGDIRNGLWEARFSASWHARAFSMPTPL